MLGLNADPTTYNTRRKVKQLLLCVYEEKTKKKQKSINKAPIMVYNWLKTLNLLPNDFDSLAKN